MNNIVEIQATLVRKEQVKSPKGDVVIESHRNIMPVTIEADMKKEEHFLALSYALKVLKELGFDLIISEDKYKEMEASALSKSLL